MPKPRKGEKEKDYIPRAIKYMEQKEGIRGAHAVAKAFGMWKQAKKK